MLISRASEITHQGKGKTLATMPYGLIPIPGTHILFWKETWLLKIVCWSPHAAWWHLLTHTHTHTYKINKNRMEKEYLISFISGFLQTCKSIPRKKKCLNVV